MNKFQPHIIPVYPPHNELIFEEWFAQNYNGCNTDRVLLPFFPTSYWVNNNYAQDLVAKKEAQDYIDSLPNDIKYFVICQYDDGCLIDWGGKDVLEFNMSKKIGVELPLLCQPHPYSFSGEKKYLVNFIGSRTHPIRNELEKFKGKEGWYISYEPHDIETYCRIMSESVFTLCPRGYGANSFRICEAMQYGSIPIYISDEFILPYNSNFTPTSYPAWWLLVSSPNNTAYEIERLQPEHISLLQKDVGSAYKDKYTYGGCYNQIIKSLETEFDNREKKIESTEVDGRTKTSGYY